MDGASSSMTAEFDALRLDFKGLGRIYVATWPYLFAQIGHFLALLALNLALLGFGTAVGFLGFDILLDSVGRAEPLSAMQAAVMLLPETGYVGVEALSESARLEVLFRFLIVSAVIIVTTTSAFTLLAMYKVWILQRVNQDLRVTMVRNAEDLSLRFHSRTSAGDGIYRVFQDSAMVTAVVDHVIVQPIIAIAMMALQIAVASLFSPYFALLMLVAGVTVVVLALAVTPRLRTWSGAARRANAALFTRVQETFQGIQAIKAYGFEDANLARFRGESTAALDTAFALRRDFAALKVAVSYLLALLLFATDYLATRFVLADEAVFGASLLVLFGMSVTQWTVAAHQARRSRIDAFALHFEELVRVWCLAQDMAVGLGRAFWLLAQKPEVSDPADPVDFPAVRDGVRFSGVRFGYAPDVPVLRGFEFAARTGEVTALVGASGERQIHGDGASPAAVRPGRGARRHRRRRLAVGARRRPAGAHRHRAAGERAFPHLRRGQPALRDTRGNGCANSRGGRSSLRDRIHRGAAGRFRDRPRRRRRAAVDRPEAAAVHRPGAGARRARPRVRRADRVSRCRDRAAGLRELESMGRGSGRHRDYPPAVHDPNRRPDRPARGRVRGGVRHARRADGAAGPLPRSRGAWLSATTTVSMSARR